MEYESVATSIRKLIADKIALGEKVRVEWITTEIVNGKNDIAGSDLPFYRTCAFSHVKEIVKRSVGKYDKVSHETDRQIVMEGFDHLQVAYTVSRGGDVILVPVDQLSDDELLARAVEYDAMAEGCINHAHEIRSYVRARNEKAA